MRIKTLLASFLLLLPALSHAENGRLDPQFGNGGIALSTVNDSGGNPLDVVWHAMSMQPDGKIVVGGQVTEGSQTDSLLARYNPDGTLDPTFGTGGLKRIDVAGFRRFDSVQALALQGDKIVAVSSVESQFALFRLQANGQQDRTFGNPATDNALLTGDNFTATSLLIDSESRILLGVFRRDTGRVVVARFQRDGGGVDTSFGSSGSAGLNFPQGVLGNAVLSRILLQADGKILLAGTTTDNTPFLARFLSDGGASSPQQNPLDPSFGPSRDGKFIVSNLQNGSFSSAALQQDGRVLAVGSISDQPGNTNALLFRCGDANCTAGDPSFGPSRNGIQTQDLGNENHDLISAVLVQPDGLIVITGFTLSPTMDAQFIAARFHSNGELDSGFAENTTLRLSNAGEIIWRGGRQILRQPDGKLLLLGVGGKARLSGQPGEVQSALARYIPGDPRPTPTPTPAPSSSPNPGDSLPTNGGGCSLNASLPAAPIPGAIGLLLLGGMILLRKGRRLF